jgi:hypothetical protein
MRQELSVAINRLADIERKLSQLDALGDDDDRTALQKRIDLIDRAALQPGVCTVCVLDQPAGGGGVRAPGDDD